MNLRVLGVLSAVMILTRFPFAGASLHLMDASWALFFLLGRLQLSSPQRVGGFLWLALLGWVIDVLATGSGLVGSYCMTPAYIGMPIAYAVLVGCGVFSRRLVLQFPMVAALSLVGTVCVAAAFAFIITNLFFYFGAGYFEGLRIQDYAQAVVHYFPLYVLVMQLYLMLWFLGEHFFSLESTLNERLDSKRIDLS